MSSLVVDVALARGSFRLAVRESFDLAGVTAIFGASGSGKTSLLRVIAGLERSARGQIRFRDTDWQSAERRLPPEQRGIGFVFQDGRLFDHLDVRGNLEFPLRHAKRPGPIGFDAAVSALGLSALLDRLSTSLSGGERQRVAIARALLANPVLLLMDEPLSSLDLPRKRELLPLIRSLPSRFGLPILYVTHNIDELVYLADNVVLLADGRNLARGTAREILERSDIAELAGIDEPGTILEAGVVRHTDALTVASIGKHELRLARASAEPGATIRLRVHPRDVILALEAPRAISIRNRLPVTLLALERSAHGQVLARLEVEGQMLAARITAEAAAELALAPGQSLFALIKSVALAEGV
jgi:molybdate transport system ATP-binding protein